MRSDEEAVDVFARKRLLYAVVAVVQVMCWASGAAKKQEVSASLLVSNFRGSRLGAALRASNPICNSDRSEYQYE